MIRYEEFGRLRLCNFFSLTAIQPLDNWEFMDRLWVGEAMGFSEWLRLKCDPTVLRSAALDLFQLPTRVSTEVLDILTLSIRPGMSIAQITQSLGSVRSSQRFVADRMSYGFLVGEQYKYVVDATIHESHGLMYLVVMTPPGEWPRDAAYE